MRISPRNVIAYCIIKTQMNLHTVDPIHIKVFRHCRHPISARTATQKHPMLGSQPQIILSKILQKYGSPSAGHGNGKEKKSAKGRKLKTSSSTFLPLPLRTIIVAFGSSQSFFKGSFIFGCNLASISLN